MNERIKELAEQATEIIDVSAKLGMPGTDRIFNKEKFAELIVRGCAKVLEIQGANTGREEYHYGAHLIEEHFGVEE